MRLALGETAEFVERLTWQLKLAGVATYVLTWVMIYNLAG